MQWTFFAWVWIFTWINPRWTCDPMSAFDLLSIPAFDKSDLEIIRGAELEKKISNIRKRIYITIDDWPTKYLLPYADELEKYWHRWIFFFIWSLIKARKKEVIEILNRWHQVANHSWWHPAFSKLSLVQAKNEIIKTDFILRETLSQSKQNPDQKLLFRYPYWDPVNKSIREEFAKFLKEKSYNEKPLMWDVDTNDWKKSRSIQEIIETAEMTKEEKVVLVHERQKTYDAMKVLLRRLYDSNKVWSVKS